MDIDFSKGEGTSTGAGTLAGASTLGYNGYASLGRRGKDKGLGSEYFEVLAAAIRRAKSQESSSDSYPRIQGKGKGKESIIRYEGQVLAGGEWVWVPEEDVIETSTSTASPITPSIPSLTPMPSSYDQLTSTSPPPPCKVIITNIALLTPTNVLRSHFSQYGNIMSFEPQIDKQNGSSLGILCIRYPTHAEAKRCVERENGQKRPWAGAGYGPNDQIQVDFDGTGQKLAAVLKELDDRKNGRKRVEPVPRPTVSPSANNDNSNLNLGSGSSSVRVPDHQTPTQTQASTFKLPSSLPPRPSAGPSSIHGGSTPRPNGSTPGSTIPLPSSSSSSTLPSNPNIPTKPSGITIATSMKAKPPPALMQARAHVKRNAFAGYGRSNHHYPQRHDRSSPPPYSSSKRDRDRFLRRSPKSSGSPSSVRPARPMGWEKDHGEVLEELGKSMFSYLKLEPDAGGQFPRQVQDEDVKALLASFSIDKIFKSSQGIFVTFVKDSARRAATYINGSLDIKLAFLKVKATACAPPAPVKTTWTDEEMVLRAKDIITEELKRALQQDVLSKYIGPQLKTMINQHQNNSAVELAAGREPFGVSMVDQINARQQGLLGLSFKKQRKDRKPVIEEIVHKDEDEEQGDDEGGPLKKKRKKDVVLSKKQKRRVLDDEGESEVESENEDEDVAVEERSRKRPLVESESEVEEPVKKKSKKEEIKRKKEVKKAGKKGLSDHIVLPNSEYDAPAIDDVRLTPGVDSLLTLSRSVTPIDSRALSTPPPTPPPVDPTEGVCDDDEDLYYTKLVLAGRVPSDDKVQNPSLSSTQEPDAEQSPLRTHVTGSARTEGFYKITHAEKAAYVTQYQSRTTNAEATAAQELLLEESKPQHITSSRSNRANARRRAQGLEEINQVQRAVALSKGEAASELTFKFNQLQTRKKHLRFARSPIHDWGLYAMERISRGEMVIEYVGEVIRAQVAEKREKAYERQGIGSSYLFRIDEDLVVDATKKGNLGRLINHSCDPNCTAKIITISGEKKIVIYAKQDIELGDEITYDYHFPFEQDKIPCLCGSAKCRGFLN
ncbi:hypothetical protein GGU10DRAFT_267972 [Lentinula aff. detonsa]|uniref:Histone-lysine N-methyltransferase, H3 lysine-4 specific n=1 Tax=Lentinula aff. detonsa TaxID=2804958 RepID=A0AA38L5W2_9AGAR|nr:hypothetical protein GGU10DRAFT_267972 [Lentinula aff. detonsa]